jgi:imidazolonepropionase-like amidohydrolase
MKLKIVISFALCTVAVTTHAEKIALVGATIINPADGKVMPNATIVINGDKIENVAMGKQNAAKLGKQIACVGKFVLPGYIDTHVHFFQSADLFTRPDGADLNAVRPYKDEVTWIKSQLDDTFRRYIRCGITSVVDVGGPFWNFQVRKKANATAEAPRVAVAGPLISSVSREKLDLGDPPIVKIDTPEQAREFVRKLAAQNPDLVKIWYIVDKDHPVETFRPIVRATIEESHAHNIRVAVHATELETARAAVEEGADILVHSVIDKPVDEAFVKLLKDRHVILCPTLVVFERYGRVFSHQLNLTPEEQAWGNPEVIATLDVTKIPQDKLPQRIRDALAKPEETLDRIKKTYDIALPNLKKLEDAGVTIAAGTDAGNIGTIHGPALFREFQLMKEAGLTPMQILQCATANAAKLFGGETGAHIGKIDNGCFGDLVILKSNPLDDIARASDIESVMKGGVLYSANSLLLNAVARAQAKMVKTVVTHDHSGAESREGTETLTLDEMQCCSD